MEFLIFPISGVILSMVIFIFSKAYSRRFLFYIFWLTGILAFIMSGLTFLVASPQEEFITYVSFHVVLAALGFIAIILAAVFTQIQEREFFFGKIIEERQQRATSEITHVAASNSNLPELLNFALEKIIAMLGLDGGVIHVFHRAKGSLVLGSSKGLSTRLARRLETIEYGDTSIGRTAKNKRLLIIRDLRLSQDYEFFGGKQDGFTYMALVPIVSEGENWGVITLFGKGNYTPGSLQVDLLEQFGEQLGEALVLGRRVRNMQSSRDNFSALVKLLGEELCNPNNASRNGLTIIRNIIWLITRLFGGDRFDILSKNPNGWSIILSSEAGPEMKFLHLNEGSNFKGISESGMMAWDEPTPFVEFAPGKSYIYCSLSQGRQWMFIRLEGRRRATIDYEILTDAFRIIWGLLNQYKIKPAAGAIKPEKERVVAIPADSKKLFATLDQVSSELDKLIADYSSANGPNDLKELLGWLGVIQKSAADGSRKIEAPSKATDKEISAVLDLNDIIEKALTQFSHEKGNGLEITYQREGKFPSPEIPQEAIQKSILEFFAAALYKRDFAGALKLVARGEDKSVMLELAGEQLSPAPKAGEKLEWLKEINGRIEYTKTQNEQGQPIDSWRMTIPFESSREKPTETMPGPLRVLAVDSQDVIRELLTSMLASLGYESTVVGSSDEALNIFRSSIDAGHPYAFVIADYALDKITGLEFAKEIKALDPDIFFLLIAGWGLEPDPELARNMGIDSILKKPFRMEQLAEIIGIARKETAQP